MKTFTVRPLIVKPFVVDPNAPQWRFFVLAGLSYLFGVGTFATGLFAHILGFGIEGSLYTWFGIVTTFLGFAFVAIGKLVRDGQKSQAEMTKRLAEQDELIRKLEERLAALTPHPPAH
jgi:hypothetical protein